MKTYFRTRHIPFRQLAEAWGGSQPINSKSSQKRGYDLLTTLGSSIMMGWINARGANAIAMR
jgi:hypothetical protein